MPLTVENNNWLLSDTSSSRIYTKTLLTKDTYVDKNIVIEVSAPVAVVTGGELNITANPVLSPVKVDGKYIITVNGSDVIAPTVEQEGWISKLPNSNVTVAGTLQLDSTVLSNQLIENSAAASGYIAYRATATKGYNNEDLIKDTDVYQGNYDLKE